MGGEAFEGTQPIDLESYEHLFDAFAPVLQAAGASRIVPIGSSGKKPVMGDVDLAVESKVSRDALADSLSQFVEVRKFGSGSISAKVPFPQRDGRYAQVDIVVGDPTYLSWARFGSSQDPHHPDFSPVKSAARNVLLNIITRFMSQAKLPYSELDRVRWSIDFDNGLYEVTQTKRGKGGRVLKDWKTTERYLMTKDPDRIVRWMFGKGIATANTQTFEGIVGALFQSSMRDEAPQILKTFASEIRDLVGKVPHMLGDEPEKVLAYIDTVAARRV